MDNVLILSAGRRVELVECFQRAARRLGVDSRIVAADCSDTAPALYFADRKRLLPRISDPRYIDEVIRICNEERIALIVPTIDTDLWPLARNKALIENETGARLLVSDESVIAVCRDKIQTQSFLERHGFGVPRMHSLEEARGGKADFPLFIKPKSGSSSMNAHKVNDAAQLELYAGLIADPIIQDFMEGEEYTVDVFLDFEGRVITVVPRLRLATRSGEIAKGRIVKDRDIIEDVKSLMGVLKPVGHITVQLMKTDKGIQYIEINPRFGGGAPMSIQCGADSCEHLYRLLRGEKLAYTEAYRSELTFLRFDGSICLDERMEVVR